MQIKYISKTPTSDEFNNLTEAVGWGKRDNKIVEEALNNTLYSLCVYDGDKLIRYGRVIGDKTIFLYIHDVVVIPEYQGKQIGTGIMQELLKQIDKYRKVNPNIRTYLGASKDYYNKQKKYEIREMQIIDDESYEEYLKEFIKEDCRELDYVLRTYDAFDEFVDNPKLNKAVQKSLSDIERIVIFLYFKNGYKTNEVAKLLDMREQSISRIKKRTLDKLRIFMEMGD